MIMYENEFTIDYFDRFNNARKIMYQANEHNIENDLRDKIKRMKQDGYDILRVRQTLGVKWVEFIK